MLNWYRIGLPSRSNHLFSRRKCSVAYSCFLMFSADGTRPPLPTHLGDPEEFREILAAAVSRRNGWKAPLDEFIQTLVTQYEKRRLGKTFVAVQTADSATVVGYYTLASSALACANLPPDLARKLPCHPIPVVLLARLAVDQSVQGCQFATRCTTRMLFLLNLPAGLMAPGLARHGATCLVTWLAQCLHRFALVAAGVESSSTDWGSPCEPMN
jgi:hypothetical protein